MDSTSYSILQATVFATKHHCLHSTIPQNSFRKAYSGDSPFLPYVHHCLEVLKLLGEWGITDKDMLVASVCHDLLEETFITSKMLEENIGVVATAYVEELTFRPTENATKEMYEAEKANKLASFDNASIQALIIKLGDRCCNAADFLRTNPKYALEYWHKADTLFAAFERRIEDISKVFPQSALKIFHYVNGMKLGIEETTQ